MHLEIVYPVHLNPQVKDTVSSILGKQKRVNLIRPLDVADMHNLVSRSYFIMTDSGGLQEEAPSLGKPVLVLRNETERPEAIIAGTVKIASTDENKIYACAKGLLDNQDEYASMARAINPYGDGNASTRIVEAIMKEFNILGKEDL